MVIEIALGIIVEAIISTLASSSTERMTGGLISKLKGDPSKKAFKGALALAIRHYSSSASGQRKLFARALMEENGFLTYPSVIAEVSKLVKFKDPPDAQIVGKHWKESLDYQPSYINFTDEAQLLLNYIKSELEESEVFRPVFQAKSLDNIATSTALSAEKLTEAVQKLESVYELTNSRFAEIIRALEMMPPDTQEIRNSIYDYSEYIEEKTRDFMGRKFITETVGEFLAGNDRGYVIIRGDPGIGKTAFMAQMVKQNGCLHHFNIRSTGVNKAKTFLTNLCAQLVAFRNLNYKTLPEDARENSNFLSRLLTEASEKLKASERILIAVDALDEAESRDLSEGVNTLYLPTILPPKVYFVLTMRKAPLNLRFECANMTIDIEQDSEGNMKDIHQYIDKKVGSSHQLQAFIDSHRMTIDQFKEIVVKKSQGNFMYLHYVLPEIESGRYQELGIDAIPEGLQNYYQNHWRLMRGKDENSWFEYRLPVLVALTIVKEPVSVDLIAHLTNVKPRARIHAVLDDWKQFLYEEEFNIGENLEVRYRVYHSSFQDFIASKEEISDERVSLKETRKIHGERLYSDYYGE